MSLRNIFIILAIIMVSFAQEFEIFSKKFIKDMGNVLNIFAASPYVIFNGFLVFKNKKKDAPLISYELMIKSSQKEFMENIYKNLGTPKVIEKDVTPPKEWEKLLQNKWIKRVWMFEDCSILIEIYEMNLNNPDYEAFLAIGKFL